MLQWVRGARIARLFKGGAPGTAEYHVMEAGVRTAAQRVTKRAAGGAPPNEPAAFRHAPGGYACAATAR